MKDKQAKNRGHFYEIGQAIVASILVVLGLLLFIIVLTPLYPYYLNPAFRILSAAAAMLLIISGVIGALQGFGRLPVSTVLIYLFTAAMVTNSVTETMTILASTIGKTEGSTPAADSGGPGTAAAASSPMTGNENASAARDKPAADLNTAHSSPFPESYLPISIPELYLLSGDDPPEFINGRLAVRGRLLRLSGDSDEEAYLLTRPAMICCAADALQVFLPLRFSKTIDEVPAADLRWIVVAGRLVGETTDIDEHTLRGRVPDTITAFDVVEKERVFVIERFAASRPPRRPYVTIFRDEPPFDF
jgi:hypothetical protein